MEFYDFLTQKDVIYIFLGIIIAYGLTKFTESVEKNLLRPFIKNMRITGQTKTGNVLSSFLELSILFIVIYLFYRFLKKKDKLPKNNNTDV